MAKYEINIEKTYQIPQNISVVPFNGVILVISPLTANWIVLQSSAQLDVLKLFVKGKSIKEILDSALYEENDVAVVVTQIEAKRFCNKQVCPSSSEKRSLHLHLTNKCNLFCPHCYMFSGHENKGELTTEEVVKLIRDYRYIANGERITLSGGEPSAHADFDRIVEEASGLGLDVKVLSNGALLSADRIANIAKYLSSVQISIDGFSEESNATIRGAGHFQKALDAVDALVTSGVETSIAITPSLKLLSSSPMEYAKFATDLIAKYEGKPFEVKFAESLSAGRNINPTEEDNDKYANIVKKIQQTIYGEEYDLMTFVETMSKSVVMDNCMFGVFAVSSVGDVYLCPEIGSLLPIANVRTTPFGEICQKASEAEYATRISKLQPCNQCDLMYICGGGCRIKEFPQLVKRSSFDKIDYTKVPPRKCSSAIKEKFYRMMVDSNEYLFVPLDE